MNPNASTTASTSASFLDESITSKENISYNEILLHNVNISLQEH